MINPKHRHRKTTPGAGGESPSAREIARAPAPEKRPLITTICMGFLDDIMRVQLFSSPQQRHATRTYIEPTENAKLPISWMDSIIEARVTRPRPSQSLLEMTSLKKSSAIREVAAISKLFSSAALAAVVLRSPYISAMGAAISSSTIMMVYGSSFADSFFSPAWPPVFSLNRYKALMPIPAPKYRSAASIVGETVFSNSFDSGALSA